MLFKQILTLLCLTYKNDCIQKISALQSNCRYSVGLQSNALRAQRKDRKHGRAVRPPVAIWSPLDSEELLTTSTSHGFLLNDTSSKFHIKWKWYLLCGSETWSQSGARSLVVSSPPQLWLSQLFRKKARCNFQRRGEWGSIAVFCRYNPYSKK